MKPWNQASVNKSTHIARLSRGLSMKLIGHKAKRPTESSTPVSLVGPGHNRRRCLTRHRGHISDLPPMETAVRSPTGIGVRWVDTTEQENVRLKLPKGEAELGKAKLKELTKGKIWARNDNAKQLIHCQPCPGYRSGSTARPKRKHSSRSGKSYRNHSWAYSLGLAHGLLHFWERSWVLNHRRVHQLCREDGLLRQSPRTQEHARSVFD